MPLSQPVFDCSDPLHCLLQNTERNGDILCGMRLVGKILGTQTVPELPRAGLFPCENSAPPVIPFADCVVRLAVHNTVKALSVCHRDLANLADALNPAVVNDFKPHVGFDCLFQLSRLSRRDYSRFLV